METIIWMVVVLCFVSVLGGPNPNPDPKPALDEEKSDNLNHVITVAAVDNIPIIQIKFRTGNSIVEDLSDTYDAVMDLYDALDGADAFKDRYMPLELTIVNGLKKKLRYKKSYFFSGNFYHHPKPLDIPPGALSALFVSNRQASPTGVTGGLEYEIVGTGKSLYLGFTAPLVGDYKTFIDVDKDKSPKWAYNQARNSSTKRVFKEGFELLATLQVPKEEAKMRFEFTIVPKGTTDKKGKS